MSLRWRIAVTLAIIAASVSAFGAVAAYVSTSSRLHNNVDRALINSARTANGPRPANGGGGSDGFQRPGECPPAGVFQSAVGAQLVSATGTVTPCIEGGRRLPVTKADLAIAGNPGKQLLRTVTIDGISYRVLTVPWHNGGVLQTARSLSEVDNLLSSLQLRLVVIGLIGIAAAAVAGWLFARKLLQPVDELRDATEHIARTQDFATNVPTGRSDEVGSLARSFSTMIEALATSREQQQQLISDASHELRTPLTSLQTNAELLGRTDLGPDQVVGVVRGIQLEVTELTNLVTEIVDLAADRASTDEVPAQVSLSDIAHTVIDRAIRRTGREITLATTGVDTVLTRPHMMERAVANLVDNALKYSPPSTAVEVTIHDTRLVVLDRGSGISGEDLPHVFDRFYRSVATRTEPGSGLGLAIVKQIVERHDGTVEATNREHGGAAVGFELPPA